MGESEAPEKPASSDGSYEGYLFHVRMRDCAHTLNQTQTRSLLNLVEAKHLSEDISYYEVAT